jgi:hypothetical protein
VAAFGDHKARPGAAAGIAGGRCAFRAMALSIPRFASRTSCGGIGLAMLATLAACGSAQTRRPPTTAIYVGYECSAQAVYKHLYVGKRPRGVHGRTCSKRFNANGLVGLSVQAASRRVAPLGLVVRAVSVNGRGVLVTLDQRPDRVDVSVARGHIDGVLGIG